MLRPRRGQVPPVPASLRRLSLDGIERKPYRSYVHIGGQHATSSVLSLALLVAFSAGSFAQQQSQPTACGFTIQASSTRPEITGPPVLVPLVYIVNQPDSPFEILSINLDGSWLSASSDRYTERTCVKYQVRNRSDRAIQHVELLLAYNGRGGAGAFNSAPISAGQNAELVARAVGGTGDARVTPIKILISVEAVTIEDCAFRPSVRLPLFLGVKPTWLW